MIDDDFRLLDPKGMDDRTSSVSDVSSCQADFKQDLVARDRCCVMTGATHLFTGCHIIPHAKGDQSGRPFVSFPSLILDEVHKEPRQLQGTSRRSTLRKFDDTRNGILLSPILHGPFGASMVAFLLVSYSTQSSSM
jgi:hypothetical protein